MHHLDAVACWRHRQAEIEFHILRHEWFLGKTAVLNPDALRHKIDDYRTEWNSYEQMIRKVGAAHQRHSARSAA
jgi:hypothetical protein